MLKVKRALVSMFDLFYHKQHPCPFHVEEFIQVVVCAFVWHGYGMNLPCFIFYYFCFSDVLGGKWFFLSNSSSSIVY